MKLKSTIIAALLATAGAAQAAPTPLTWNPVSVVGTGAAANSNALSFAEFSGDNLYASVTMLVGAGFTPAAGDQVWVWLDKVNTNTSTHAQAPNFGLSGQASGGDVRIRPENGDGKAVLGSVLSAGNTFTLLVHLYKSVSGASNVFDSMEAWYNPSAGSLPNSKPSVIANLNLANDPDGDTIKGLSSFSFIGLRSSLDSGETVTVSGLKLGSAYGDVSPVPEASGLAMLLAGLGMMGFIARRRIGS